MLYGTLLDAETMRARKREVFARLVRELRALDERFGTESSLAAALDGKPNNARLASLATYYECVPGFERLLAESEHTTCRASTRRSARSPNYRAKNGARASAVRRPNSGFDTALCQVK